MDSLTQLTCGAAIGELVLGPKVGRKAMLWGAIVGTLPDLDVLIPLNGPVEDFVYHRGFSHSMLVLAVAAPVLAWGITKIHPSTRANFKGWWLLTFCVLQAAVLLDLMNVYGTQVLWPFGSHPQSVPILFIIDPLFTLPMLIGVTAALITRRPIGHRLNSIGLALSLLYLIWAFSASTWANHRVRDELEERGIAYEKLVSTPTPFNTLLFRFVGVDGDRYFETYRSLFDGDVPLEIRYYPRNPEELVGLEQHKPLADLRWFTGGVYAAVRKGSDIVVNDLRMGGEPHYVFRFKVAEASADGPVPTRDEQLPREGGFEQLPWIWERIWSPIPLPDPDPATGR